MKKNKIVIFVVCILILSLTLIWKYPVNDNQKQSKSFSVEMIVSDQSDLPITSYSINNNSIDILFDLIYSSDLETEGKLVLLKNFQPIPFSINGGSKKKEYEFSIFKTLEEMISKNNVISINSLDSNRNDMCILLFVKDSIYTYRFQIENTNAKNNINPEFTNTYNVTTDFGEKSQFFSSSNMLGLSEGVLSVLDNSSNNFYCAVDLEKILADTSAIDSYKNRKKELNRYAVVPILNNQIIGDVFYCESIESRFAFKISAKDFAPFDSIRFMIFPYPNEFNNNFLKTYKAFLWSDPYITYNLFQEEK